MHQPTPKKKSDALTLLAKVGADKRRRRPLLVFVALGIVLAVLVAAALWRFGPAPVPRVYEFVAYDQAARPDQAAALRAQLVPLDPDERGADLSGLEVQFVDPATGQPVNAVTDRSGAASAELRFAEAAEYPLVVTLRYLGDQRRRHHAVDGGYVFVWPADTALLVVDLDHGLFDTGAEALRSSSEPNLLPRADAAAALREAQKKYRVVYLSAADEPETYRKLAKLIRQIGDPETSLPLGPLLGWAGYPAAADETAFRQAAIADLKKRYAGTAVGVTGRADVARLYHAAGLRTFLLGDGADAPEGVAAVASWNELAKQLP